MSTPDQKQPGQVGSESLLNSGKIEIPTKYRGLPSELVESLWTNPVYVDEAKNQEEKERRESMINLIKEKENKREDEKIKILSKRYQELLDQDKIEKKVEFSKLFSKLHEQSKQTVSDFFNEKIQISLLPEEEFVLNKMKKAYLEAKEKNPDQPVKMGFSREIDSKVYNNLLNRLAFRELEKKKATEEEKNKQKQIDSIRGRIGLKDSKEVLLKELKDKSAEIYFKAKSEGEEDIRDLMDSVGKGYNLDGSKYEEISGEIGQYFDAHGITKGNELERLINLLDTGIDKTKDFYTAPFEVPEEERAGRGAGIGTGGGTAYKEGMFIITSGYKESIQDNGIKNVFINDAYGELKHTLQKMYPQYKFYLLSEQKKALEEESQKNPN